MVLVPVSVPTTVLMVPVPELALSFQPLPPKIWSQKRKENKQESKDVALLFSGVIRANRFARFARIE